MEYYPNWARYATIFAADCEPHLYQNQMTTYDWLQKCKYVGIMAEKLRVKYAAQYRPFYAQSFVEQAARHWNETEGRATLSDLRAAGMRESNSRAAE